MAICEMCGAAYEPKGIGGVVQKYCQGACRSKAARRRARAEGRVILGGRAYRQLRSAQL